MHFKSIARAILLTAAGVSTVGFSASSSASPQLAVLQVGDGTTNVNLSGMPIRIDYFDPAQLNQSSPLSATLIPSTGANALVLGGEQPDGQLVTAPNGDLVFGGYHVNAGISNVSASSSLGAPRAVGLIHALTNFTLAASYGSVGGGKDYSGQYLSSAATDGNGHFWGASDNSGTIVAGGGAGNVIIQSAFPNTRTVSVVNGKLYFSAIHGTKGIYSLGPAASATSAITPTLVLPTGTNSIPNDFVFNNDETIAYVSDDRHGSIGQTHTGAGVQRWDKIGGTWTLSFTFEIDPAVGSAGALGLGVDWSGANPVVYASTDDETTTSRILRWVDIGAGSAQTTLATAGTNTTFRGVEFVVPEPAALGLILPALSLLICRRRAMPDR